MIVGLILAYDTETTGLPLFDQPSEDPRQPHIVQLGAILADSDTRRIFSSINLVARPDGWTIPDDVAQIHGIITEIALRVGVSEKSIIQLLYLMSGRADLRIAHNRSFDDRIARIAMKRFGWTDEEADEWKSRPADCTAERATPLMKLPPTPRMLAAGRKHFKTPNLGEAHSFFLGRPLEGAHDAMADVTACLAIYFAIEDLATAGMQGVTPLRAPETPLRSPESHQLTRSAPIPITADEDEGAFLR